MTNNDRVKRNDKETKVRLLDVFDSTRVWQTCYGAFDISFPLAYDHVSRSHTVTVVTEIRIVRFVRIATNRLRDFRFCSDGNTSPSSRRSSWVGFGCGVHFVFYGVQPPPRSGAKLVCRVRLGWLMPGQVGLRGRSRVCPGGDAEKIPFNPAESHTRARDGATFARIRA